MSNKNLLSSIAEIDKANSKIKSFINSIVDANSFVETDALMTGKGFNSAVEALGEGVVTGYATLFGMPVHLFAQNAEVLKGSLSQAQANKILKCMDRATKTGTPFISIIDSCGARVGDGTSIMEGYASLISGGIAMQDEIPHICIINGVCTGMMTTFAATADFTFMSKDAIMSVNSPMYLVSDAKSFPVDYKSQLGFDAYKKTSDVAQFIYNDVNDLAKVLKMVLTSDDEEEKDVDANTVNPNLEKVNAVEAVELICDAGTVVPYCAEYAQDVSCSIAQINGISVGVVATKDKYMSINGIEKISTFVEKMGSFDIPVITLVDTLGVNPTLAQETAGVAKKTLALMKAIKNSSSIKIGVAFGNAVGFGYSALMSKAMGFGYTLATTRAKVSPVSEEVAVAMMCDQLQSKDRAENLKALSEKYAEMQVNPLVAAKDGYLDNVIEATNLRPYISSALMMLMGI